ncbi:MAG: metallophosphoesterase family protein, partial [Dethiobacteria bacterium]
RKLLQGGGLKIGLIHGDGMRRAARQRAEEAFRDFQPQVIVFGHTHQPLCVYSGKTLLFNPGSCVDPRGAGGPSYGILHLDSAGITGEIIFL